MRWNYVSATSRNGIAMRKTHMVVHVASELTSVSSKAGMHAQFELMSRGILNTSMSFLTRLPKVRAQSYAAS